MAKGRRDYTWGVLQDSIMPGRYSANFYKNDQITLAWGANGDAINYTVPAGYKLFLTGMIISTISPSINWVMVLKDSLIINSAYYSLNYTIDLGSFGSYVFNAGEKLVVRCVNYDFELTPFYITAIGVLEQLV